MFPYWLMFGVFAVGAVSNAGRAAPMHRTTLSLFLGCTLIVLLIGLRFEVGADWVPYEQIYFEISVSDLADDLLSIEPAYLLLNKVAYEIGGDIWLVNLVCGLIFMTGLLRFAKDQPNPWLAILIAIPYLVIGVAMGYTRQGAAIGLILMGLSRLRDGRALRVIGWILAASLFHRTAFLLIGLAGLSFSRNRLQSIVLAAGSLVVAYFVLIRASMDHYLVIYVENVYASEGSLVRLIMNALPAVIYVLLAKRMSPNPNERTFWLLASALSILSLVAWYMVESSVIVDRLAIFLIPLQVVVFSRLPEVLGGQRAANNLISLSVIALFGTVQFVWLNFANHAEEWLPYKFFPLW